MRLTVESIWRGASSASATARVLLAPAAAAYRGVTGIRNALYDMGVLRTQRAAIPVVSNATITGQVGAAIVPVQITATNNPTSFNAFGLPRGLSVNTATGQIGGRPEVAGDFAISLSATNATGT